MASEGALYRNPVGGNRAIISPLGVDPFYMSGTPYLRANKPRRSQFRSPRRAKLRGVIVVHTTESAFDAAGADMGAENVAGFIARRTDPGSYHDLVDSDSFIHLVSYDDEAYQDGTGSNPWAYGLAFACRTTDWARMSDAKRTAMLDIGARRAAEMNKHCRRRVGISIPSRRLTKSQSDRGVTGFIAHGDRDPARRTDPGTKPPHLFPWDEFLNLYSKYVEGGSTPPPDGGLTVSDVKKLSKEHENLGGGLYAIADGVNDLKKGLLEPLSGDGQSRADRMADIPRQVKALDAKVDKLVELVEGLSRK